MSAFPSTFWVVVTKATAYRVSEETAEEIQQCPNRNLRFTDLYGSNVVVPKDSLDSMWRRTQETFIAEHEHTDELNNPDKEYWK